MSKNFEILKFCSILMVFTGHFFGEIEALWVPATIGLLIFSFSSGYFTGKKYRGGYGLKAFWWKKVERLGLNLLLINLVLLCLFLIQGKSGIWTWQTLVNMVGLNGFLNWFRIGNPSPFGGGMWFFTLLLIFYACYPLLEKIKKTWMLCFTVLFVLAAFWLNIKISYGHALWLTACGFVVGTLFGRHDIQLPPGFSAGGAFLTMALMAWLNYSCGIKSINFFLMLFFAIFLISSLIHFWTPEILVSVTSIFSACLLEIYLLHGYFSIRQFDAPLINYIISLGLVLLLAKLLNSLALVCAMKLKR